MNRYSDWIIIPEDRACDLPHGAKVQVLLSNKTLEEAEASPFFDLSCYVNSYSLWDKKAFAYRILQGTADEVEEYECWAFEFSGRDPWFCRIDNFRDPYNEFTKGTAKQIKRNGVNYSFTWVSDE